MENEVDMLRAILKSSGWSQEQLASRLGVTFATVNAWLNNKSKPREIVKKRIRDLYLAKNVSYVGDPIYITLTSIPKNIRVGNIVLLEKDLNDECDEESIKAALAYAGSAKRAMHVANSVENVVRGTWSAGRIYDKLDGIAKARVDFVANDFAIARVVDFGMGER